MRITVQKWYYFDIEKERNRILRCFKGDVRKRQIKLLEEFVNGNFGTWIELYNNLPYNNDDECPEQEYVGLTFGKFVESSCNGEFDKIIKIERNK